MDDCISVIIPCFKARNFLAESLASLASQTCRPHEVILIDDCSPEPIDDLVADYEQLPGAVSVRVIRHEKNKGLGASRNTGIRAAHCRWVALLDHDDLWAPDHLASLVEAREENQGDLIFCTVKQFCEKTDDSLGLWGPQPGETGDKLPMALFERSFITPSATLIRRDLLLELDGFDTDPRVHLCEDLDLWLRLLERGARFVHVGRPTCFYRKHDQAATSRQGYMSFQSAWVRQKNAPRVVGSWWKKQRILAFRWWAAWLAFLETGQRRWDIFGRAIFSSLPVPKELARGLVRTLRKLRKFREREHSPGTR